MDNFNEAFEFIDQLLDDWESLDGDVTAFIEHWALLLTDNN